MAGWSLRVIVQVLLVAIAFAVIAYYYEKMIRINMKFLAGRGKTVREKYKEDTSKHVCVCVKT